MHIYEPALMRRAAEAHRLVREGADPLDVLEAVVWPSARLAELTREPSFEERAAMRAEEGESCAV